MDEGDGDSVFSGTLIKLVRLSESLDLEGKYEQSEEIHRILRKHAGNIMKPGRKT